MCKWNLKFSFKLLSEKDFNMNMKSAFVVLLSYLQMSSVHAAQWKDLVVLGSGCSQKESNVHLIKTKEELKIPLTMNLTKKAEAALLRKSCQFTLPVVLKKDEKIEIYNVSQKFSFHLQPTQKMKTTLEIFWSGQKGNPLEVTEKQIKAKDYLLEAQNKIESACGQDTILRGNLSSLLQGEGEAQAQAKNLVLKYKIIKCN